jgi:hypothetical protein
MLALDEKQANNGYRIEWQSDHDEPMRGWV